MRGLLRLLRRIPAAISFATKVVVAVGTFFTQLTTVKLAWREFQTA